jgi:hypothetical protein
MSDSDSCDPAQRRLVLRALAATAFAGGLLGRSAWAQETYSRLPVKLPPGQSIYRVAGDVRVNGAAANLRTRISAGDTIETGRDGEVAFVVGSDAILLRRDSQATMQATEQNSALLGALRLVTGAVLSVFGGGRRYTLTTPTATIGIRGTGVYLEVDPERTYFCTCYGIADVSAVNDAQSTATIASRHHDRPVYILGTGETAAFIRDAPFVNHTDQELMLIETLAGRTVPFVFPRNDYRAPRRTY